MLSFNFLLAACLGYAAILFAVAFLAERAVRRGGARWLRGATVYTLSLSIYCTAWTFYGAVGYAARSGLEFATIYLGPTLVMIGWWGIVRKLVRIGRTQRITSIADLISSRYGKSTALGALVTFLAVVGTTPYIALQLQSVTLSFAIFAGPGPADRSAIALWVAGGLAIFTIVFGTRNLDVDERHDGIVTAIALEAVVKLVALIAVGLFVVFWMAGGPSGIFAMTQASEISRWDLQPGRWAGLTVLSAAAFLCLPRMFHVLVVENADERHLATAGWAFPLYLFAMSLFVVPIAVVGLATLPDGANPDLFVLSVPLDQGQDLLATLAFLGGFSSATSMVIVAAIALATMVSNHVVMPIWLRSGRQGALVSGDVRRVVILSRRLAIAAILGMGYLYYDASGGGTALAAIGLISFVGVAQVLPALLGGIFWRGATRIGAAMGLTLGLAIWGWTLFLPSFGDGTVIAASVMAEGPFGLSWLRPQALFGIGGIDPVLHALLWSMTANAAGFVGGSLASFPRPIERLQGAAMVGVFRTGSGVGGWSPGRLEAEDLLLMAQRLIGPREAQRLFQAEAADQGKDGYLPQVTPDFVDRLERQIAGSVGAATAHAMMGQITGGVAVTVEDLMRMADETAQVMEYSARLETQSAKLSRVASQLREANGKLTELSAQKDAFLAQISHELRTPMTSIHAFSEILRDGEGIGAPDRARFAGVIHDEAARLTRLLDDLLDLDVLESGRVSLRPEAARLADVIGRALAACGDVAPLRIRREGSETVWLLTDADRLAQVFINLIANSAKYCVAERPELRIATSIVGDHVQVDFVDNGRGIPRSAQPALFEKFARPTGRPASGGAGLGLAICREIMSRLEGDIAYLPAQGGAAFRVRLPLRPAWQGTSPDRAAFRLS